MDSGKTYELKRDLGFWSALSIVVGTIIGSGIFLVPTSMVQKVGSPEMVILVFVFGGALSLAGALSYAELAAMLPKAGGEYIYLKEAYGPFWGFLYNWAMTWVGRSGSVAAMTTGFVYYFANFVPELDLVIYTVSAPIGPGGGPLEITYGQLLAIGVIAILAAINFYGVKLGGRVQVAVTAAKVALIAGIVAVGLSWSGGSVANYKSVVPSIGGVTGFFAALVGALWAYDGWNNAVLVASEIKNPQRNLPRSLISGVLLVMVVYVVTNLAYFYVLPAADVAASDRVAASMMERVFGPGAAAIVSLIAMVSIFGAVNGSLLSSARIPYAAARDGLFMKSLARVHPVHRTPSVSIFTLSALAGILVLSGRFEQLFTYVIFTEWLLYGMTAAAVIVLRRRRPDLPRPYKCLGYPAVPVLFCIGAIFLLVSTAIDSPRESIMGMALLLVGIPFYFYWKRRALM